MDSSSSSGFDHATYDSDDASGPAFTAAILGVLAMTLNMLMLCTCYMSLFPGGVLGAIAFVMARMALAEDPTGASRAYANIGQATGLIAFLYFLMFLVAIFLYIMLYVVMIVMVVIAEGL